MSLTAKINEDIKDAMRARQSERLSTLRLLKSAVQSAAIDKHGAGGELSDDEVAQVIRKQVKQRQDSIASYEKGGREELAAKERAEMELLNSYLPKGLSPEELAAVVREAIVEVGAISMAQMGQVMKLLKEKAGGRADGKSLSDEVRRQLK